jgi:hypothetical protein
MTQWRARFWRDSTLCLPVLRLRSAGSKFQMLLTFGATSQTAYILAYHESMRSPTDGDDHLSGPNTLLRFLRSPDDPSQNGGPSKIGLATRAWHMSTPQIPAKAEILKEWILSTWDQKWTE